MSEELPRNFKGIWIPREIWLHKNLDTFEKILWAEIDSLDHPEKGCTASNEYLRKFFGIQERTLQRGLAKLKKEKLIHYSKFDGRQRTLRSCLNKAYDNLDTTEVSQECCGDRFDTSSVTDLTPHSPKPIYDIEQREEQREVTPSVSKEKLIPFEAIEIANDLWKRILLIHPKHRQPDIRKWAKTIWDAHKIDERTWDDIKLVLKFIFESSAFWSKNIQSADSLRDKFDKIWIQMQPAKTSDSRIQENLQTAFEAKKALAYRNQENLLSIHKTSISRQNGESVSLDLPVGTFNDIILGWFPFLKVIE